MSGRFAIMTVLFVLARAASGDITAGTTLVYHGPLSDGTEVWSYDLQVTITGADVWTVFGGPAVDEPWATLTGGTFFQSEMNDANPPDPDLFPMYPDSRYTSFYTSPWAWPNTTDQGEPAWVDSNDTPTALQAEMWVTSSGDDFPGTFTLARFTIIPDGPDWSVLIDAQIGSREYGVISFVQTLPEPSGLALLVLGGAVLSRRRGAC